MVASSLPLIAGAVSVDRPLPDDALITLTFAKNIIDGNGWVFNQPPPVLGTTTPAFTLAIAAISSTLGGAPTTVAVWTSAVAWLLTAWLPLLFRRALRLTSLQAALIGLSIIAGGAVDYLGMESAVFCLVLLLTVALRQRGTITAAGLAAGTLFLIRGEGILLPAILGSSAVLGELRGCDRGLFGEPTWPGTSVRFTAAAAVPILAWSVYALPTFGSILPNTLAAKLAQSSSGVWKPFGARLVEEFLPSWAGRLSLSALPWFGFWAVLVLVGIGVALAVHRALAPLPVWAVAYTTGYAALGVAGYHWYRLPLDFVGSVMFGLGLGWGIERVARTTRSRIAPLLLTAATIGLLAWDASSVVARIESPRESAKEQTYRQLAAWLEEHGTPGARVAHIEVGYLGYYTSLGIVDLVGLVSPEVTDDVARGVFSAGFWSRLPEYLVYVEGSRFYNGIIGDPRFVRFYAPLVDAGTVDDEGTELILFARRSVVEPD